MFIKITLLLVAVGLISQCDAYKISPGNAEDDSQSMDPFVKIGNGYYYVGRTPKTWFQAFKICRQMNANLVEFETLEEWMAVNDFMWNTGIGDTMWTAGAALADHETHEWFTSGRPFAFNMWHPQSPDNGRGSDYCDVMGFNRNATNKYLTMDDRQCESLDSYLCEAPPPPPKKDDEISKNVKITRNQIVLYFGG
ncbi:hypothetical protein KR018_011636 [Drosophila ironensis]|nr:hypothetical protein KR018_011636 [Drosophila ironensis]